MDAQEKAHRFRTGGRHGGGGTRCHAGPGNGHRNPGHAAPAPAAVSTEDVTAPQATPPKPTKQDKKQVGQPTKFKKSAPGSKAGSKQLSTLAACPNNLCYFYAGAVRDDEANPVDGITVRMTIHKPVKDTPDYHSLGEIAVLKDINGKRQIVEVGWTVNPAMHGDDDPHLFVYHWVDDAQTCYNGCGWVDYAPTTLNAGANIASMIGTQRWARIQYSGGNWWVSFDGQWIGYFPGSLWTSAGVTTFTNTTYQHVYGEIATTDDATCGDMGNGVFATSTTGARMGSLNKIVGGTASLTTYNSSYATVPAKWSYYGLSNSTFNYGGPGCTGGSFTAAKSAEPRRAQYALAR